MPEKTRSTPPAAAAAPSMPSTPSTPSTPPTAATAAATAAFEAWLRANGMAEALEVVAICDAVPGAGGRGLVARRAIAADARLFAVPRPLLLTVDALRQHASWHPGPLARAWGDAGAAALPEQAMLAVALLAERSRADSFWKPYLAMLPAAYPTVPVCFPPPLRRRLPAALAEAVERQRDALTDAWVRLEPVLTGSEWQRMTRRRGDGVRDGDGDGDGGPTVSRPPTIRDFQWAWVTVNTRCITYRSDAVLAQLAASPRERHQWPTIAMVPLLDLLNHANGPRPTSGVTDERRGFELALNTPFAAGDPVFLPYGRHGLLTFLTEYGFIPSDRAAYPIELPLASAWKTLVTAVMDERSTATAVAAAAAAAAAAATTVTDDGGRRSFKATPPEPPLGTPWVLTAADPRPCGRAAHGPACRTAWDAHRPAAPLLAALTWLALASTAPPAPDLAAALNPSAARRHLRVSAAAATWLADARRCGDLLDGAGGAFDGLSGAVQLRTHVLYAALLRHVAADWAPLAAWVADPALPPVLPAVRDMLRPLVDAAVAWTRPAPVDVDPDQPAKKDAKAESDAQAEGKGPAVTPVATADAEADVDRQAEANAAPAGKTTTVAPAESGAAP
ncbi:hypothetical protein CXG81DRAFT_25953 [Caulochytrium protostelioides]|uniref:Uncharacterized protein n=1 Tax=Caulochytrium protostelioides TaxID=1555241 RepID=A0A4P9X7Y1_9FUNG|nr:hypothetical protein CXG81DRAFT_25953 [Caulochytrium protostelioides]|eukprot:RKP01348.1 hypothetical protein CXG81DRAFT_25953 [Caulochytrium protostelioides]